MLTQKQIVSMVIYGTVLWALAAAFINISPYGFDRHIESVAIYIVTIPISWLFFKGAVLVGKLDKDCLVSGVTLATLTAALLDGIAQTWAPQLYGGPIAHVQLGAALLLWGIGIVLLIAIVARQTTAD